MTSSRRLFLTIMMLLTICPAQRLFAQATSTPLHVDLGKTLGFIVGQRISLTRIKTEYPALSLRASRAQREFTLSFGIAEENIQNALRDIFSDRYPEYIASTERHLASTLMSQRTNLETATRFIDEVETRAKGQIPSPILETLLSYQFIDRPAQEFRRGFKVIYRTKEHPKAKGVDFQVEYPRSWSAREGKRPNVIQFFISNNGRGPVYASVMVRDLIKEAKETLSREQIAELRALEWSRTWSKELASGIFSDSGLREMAQGMGMDNVRNMTTERIVLDLWPGAMLSFVGDGQRLDTNLTSYNRMYIAIYRHYMLFLQLQVAMLPNETEDALKARVSKTVPLFRLMANSMVIQSQY